MKKKDTNELMDELIQSDNTDEYCSKNAQFMVNDKISIYLNNILENKGLVKSKIIKKTELSEVQCYQIFDGRRKPSRDSLLSICIAMELSLDETQQMLKTGGFAPLYPKNKRDVIIIKGIQNNLSVAQINEHLYDMDLPTINS